MLKIEEANGPVFHQLMVTHPYRDGAINGATITLRGRPDQTEPQIDLRLWQGSCPYTVEETEQIALIVETAAFLARMGSIENAIGCVETGSTTHLPGRLTEIMVALRAARQLAAT